MEKRKPYVTSRDKKILAFVERYRCVTTDILAASGLFESARRSNVRRIVRRLRCGRLIHCHEYAPGRLSITISQRGCAVIGLPKYTRRPMTEQSMPVAWAIAWYCLHHGVARLTDREFRTQLPELWRPGMRSASYYLFEKHGRMRLGMFMVDRGAVQGRFRGKIQRVVHMRDRTPAFDALIESGRFQITILVGSPRQQLNVSRFLSQEAFGKVETQVSIVRELGTLLTLR